MFSTSAFSCDTQPGKAFPSLVRENEIFVFDEVPIEKEPGGTSTTEQIGIDINLFDCSSATKKLVGQLPFLASTGKIRAAFFAKTGKNSKVRLFVIHSVEIRADTGLKYSGDYYTINIYKKSTKGYIRDEQISSYFGDGGDILSNDYKELAYTFPYKTELSIVEKLATENYRNWVAGTPTTLTTNKKTLIYPGPVLAEPTKMFLIKGDEVKQEAVQAGWLSVMFKTPKGKEIRGWIKCEDADGC